MARLTFSNVPTATGGVISGNISTGAGSPFGEGGKYEAQVSRIQAEIAKAPKGFYDPVGWDDFLKKSEQIGLQPTRADDPEIMKALVDIPQARTAMIGLGNLPFYYTNSSDVGGVCDNGVCFRFTNYKLSQTQRNTVRKQKSNYESEIALHLNRLVEEKNAPLIQAIEEHERQLEIDQAVKLALEQKVRETATPKPTPTTPVSTISILPIIIIAVALIGILLFLRSRA